MLSLIVKIASEVLCSLLCLGSVVRCPILGARDHRLGSIFFPFNHFQIFLDKYCTNLVTSALIFSLHAPRPTRLGFAVVVSSHSTFKSSPGKSSRIRTSGNPCLQPLWNPHFQERLLSADSKRLILAERCLQLFCNQHLRTSLGSVGNTGFITPLESALTENPRATPLESALPKNRGEGG
jgi:hypothetical protein